MPFQDGGEGRAGVFRINIDAAAENCLMANVAAGQVEAALDREMSFVFDLLGNDLPEDQLFGEIFGADDDAVFARGTASRKNQERADNDEGDSHDFRPELKKPTCPQLSKAWLSHDLARPKPHPVSAGPGASPAIPGLRLPG